MIKDDMAVEETTLAISPGQALDWLCGAAFPLWLHHGVDWRSGAFYEDLDPATLSPRARFRRLRVGARQLYSFSQAARLGVPRAADAVALGLGFLRQHALQDDGGYAMRFDMANTPTDQTRDLYDHAFVMLALTHAGERQAVAALLDYIEASFTHDQEGFHEAVPRCLPRRQNPHMHLLEALLAAGERFEDMRYLDLADGIVDLFASRFFQIETSGLAEFYDDALQPKRHAGRFIIEPGHHHEWVWLLCEHRRLAAHFGRPVRNTHAEASGLMAFAERYGVRPDGIIAGELWSDGEVRQSGTRVWPHTERLKAVMRVAPEKRAQALSALFRFFNGMPAGLWCERWADGFVAGEAAPASTLYHITVSILEAQRAA